MISKSKKGKHTSPGTEFNIGHKTSIDVRDKISKTLRYGIKHKEAVSKPEYKKLIGLKSKESWKRPEYREKIFSKTWNNTNYREFMTKILRKNAVDNWKRKDVQEKRQKSWKIRPNNLEKDFEKIMKEYIPIKFVGDLSFFVDGLNPDFIIEGTNICIDIFGNYWHKVKKRDDSKERIERFKKEGYILIVVWENQWKNNKTEVVEYCKSIVNQPTICI